MSKLVSEQKELWRIYSEDLCRYLDVIKHQDITKLASSETEKILAYRAFHESFGTEKHMVILKILNIGELVLELTKSPNTDMLMSAALQEPCTEIRAVSQKLAQSIESNESYEGKWLIYEFGLYYNELYMFLRRKL